MDSDSTGIYWQNKDSYRHQKKGAFYPQTEISSKQYKPQKKQVQSKKTEPDGYRNYPKSTKSLLIMNNLAPRFQQRAFYSQFYQTDYEKSWRANLLAAANRQKCTINKAGQNSDNKLVVSLGIRPDPEGAPAKSDDESDDGVNNKLDFYKVLNEDSVLFSDYGSESEPETDKDEQKLSRETKDNAPNASWSTAALLNHAFSKSNTNKVTIMTYAVIGAELHSISKLHTSKTESELSKLLKKTQKVTENIDRARKGLKDIALALRAFKQEVRAQNSSCLERRETSHSHQNLVKMDFPSSSEEIYRKTPRKKHSVASDENLSSSKHVPEYCTMSRNKKNYKPKIQNIQSNHNFSLDLDDLKGEPSKYRIHNTLI